MATKIVTKNSSTASAVPTASDLVQGELAVNVADKRLFTEDNTGTIVELGTNPSTIDINAGSIDGTAIGASSASTGAFTTLTATGAFTSVGIDDNADATAITIDSSENVGIGTSSPEARLHASGGENSVHAVFGTRATRGLEIGTMIGGDGATDNTAFYNMKFSSNGSHVWQAGGSERMRIDSSGNVGIGTSSPISKMQVSGANNGDVFYLTSSDVEDDRGLMFSNSTNGIIWDLDAKGASSLFGQMTFSTNGTERMRIDSSGRLFLGKTSATATGFGTELRGSQIIIGKTSSGTVNGIYFNHNSSYVGGLNYTNTATALATSSDQRLKENIADADDAGSKIDAIQVRKFDWKEDNSHQEYGFIAQELEQVFPYAVHTAQNEMQTKGVDYASLVPMMLKEIQSLRNRVAQLEE